MSAIEDVPIIDYIKAVGEQVGGKNITFASKISNNRICLYLPNKKIVDTIITTNRTIKINNHIVEIRRLITPADRIILSNVCPSILHNILEKSLLDHGIKTCVPH